MVLGILPEITYPDIQNERCSTKSRSMRIHTSILTPLIFFRVRTDHPQISETVFLFFRAPTAPTPSPRRATVHEVTLSQGARFQRITKPITGVFAHPRRSQLSNSVASGPCPSITDPKDSPYIHASNLAYTLRFRLYFHWRQTFLYL